MDVRGRLAQSLKPGKKRRDGASARLRSHASTLGWLRLPRRWLGAIIALNVPRGLGATLASFLLLASAGYGAVRGGHVADMVVQVQDFGDRAANGMGFGISDIAIAGQHEVPRADILALAGITERSSLLFLDAARMRASLSADPWIAEATVLKLYPGGLRIAIVERKPFALWQKDGQVSLISAEGIVLDANVPQRFAALPLLVGTGAERTGHDFLALLARYPDIARNVAASILVAERRWNLHLKSGIDVMLPEREPERALSALADLDRSKKLLSRDIVAVDLRLPDRVTVRQSDAAAAARDQAFKDAEKAKKAKMKGSDA
jgi:cell division protein FtsQ